MQYPDSLYRKAYDIFDIQPWAHVSDTQLIAFKSEYYDEPIFINFMGRLGQHLAIGAYFGYRGLFSLWEIEEVGEASDPMTSDDIYAFSGQDCVQISFESTDDAYEDQLDSAYSYAERFKEKITGRKDIPSFADFRPGYQPFTLKDEQRLKVLVEAMDVVILYGDMHRGNYRGIPDNMGYDDTPAPYFIKENGRWKESTLELPEYNNEKFLTYISYNNDIKLRKLKKLKQEGELDLELRLGPIIDWDEKLEAYRFTELLLCYSHDDDELFEPISNESKDFERSEEEILSGMLERFVDALLEKGIYPETINCRGFHTIAFIEDLSDKLDIETHFFDDMEKIDELLDSLDDLNETDEDGYNVGIENALGMLAEMLEQVPKDQFKLLPDYMKDMILELPEDAVHPELFKKIQKYRKYLK